MYLNMYKDVKYFKGLNALRFFAAYLVVIHHAEQIRMKYGLFHLKEYSLFNNGGIAVTFFFVLSGFLISYLLFKESDITNTISVKKFYFRRILRIWPLYFLIVIIGIIFLPYILDFIGYSYSLPYSFNDVILYYILFSPFMVNIFYGHHLIEPLWSIGVEELYYIVWAPLFKFLRNYILPIIILIIFVRSLLMYASFLGYFDPVIQRLIKMLRFEAMAIGGLGAYLIYNYSSILTHFLFSRLSQFLLIIFVLLRIFAFKLLVAQSMVFNFLFTTPVISQLVIMIIFAWLIINISLNPKSIVRLDNKILNFLGNISYGIYMYHMLVIFGIVVFFKQYLLIMNSFPSSIIFYLLLTTLVIIVSYLSKRFFEDYFLSFKKRFRISS
jgi:peptidoglycan/LPS O-acetylase OafA/YrhL